MTLEGKNGYVAGRNSLGHALEAATIGYAFDADVDTIKAGGDQFSASD